jgi:NADPH2:quinone reductase
VAHLAGDIGVVDLVRAGGRFVSTMVMSPDQVPTQSAVVVPVYANPTPEVLEKCAARQAGGETKVAVQHVYPFNQVTDAFDRFAQGTLGKVVVSID